MNSKKIKAILDLLIFLISNILLIITAIKGQIGLEIVFGILIILSYIDGIEVTKG